MELKLSVNNRILSWHEKEESEDDDQRLLLLLLMLQST